MFKWIKRILLSLLAAIVVTIAIIAAFIVWDVNFGVQATDFSNVSYQRSDGTVLDAYIALPEGEGPFPGVLMAHEWWGLNAEIVELADKLAEEGYVVLAPDNYRGKTAGTIPGALYLRLTVDSVRVDEDMLFAYDYLLDLPDTTDAIGVVGFCYGGDVAFDHAVANPDIDAVINLYGSTRSDTDMFGALLDADSPPILAIFGEADTSIPLEDVAAHESALASANLDATVTIYDDMNHAFVQPDAIDDGGAPQAAWEEILAFFETHLTEETPSEG